MSVKVGVRVRPFNSRQTELNCKLCVDMHGVTTKLLDLEDAKRNRDFSFDYSFWSHDCFQPNAQGYFEGTSSKYADQQLVYRAVGVEILDNAWEGYHCCLFAYGQTGAGKSYSMVGYGANKGIVPISCSEIFNRIQKNTNPTKQYEVDISMLEIYNERVQDLLIPIVKRPKQGLKIRQHKTQGVYVEGLTKHPVSTYQMIEEKMDQGSRNRSVAATEMNANSSRAHTIISIEFRQKQIVNDKKVQKLSVIYLVDLAGSQKVGKTGATGDRLKQAAGINKSLSVLGLVISTLADKAMGKGKNIIVPYRDSCLTRILQNALGGNSKTLMICAISPATDNYQQTLSTLRYADQAKKIQNKAVINESQTDKMIRELTEQNKKLKDYLEMFSNIGVTIKDEATLAKFQEIQSELKFNTQMIDHSSMTKQDREKIEEESSRMTKIQEPKIDMSKPHLTNLNEDPQLSQKIFYSIQKEQGMPFVIGKKSQEHKNDLEINSFGMPQCLATIIRVDGKVIIKPVFIMKCYEDNKDYEGNSNNAIYLNGAPIIQPTQLFHNDRLKFGLNSMFVAILPGVEERERVNKEAEIDWEYAERQLIQHLENIQKQKEQKYRQEQKRQLVEKEAELVEVTKKKIEDEMKIYKEKIQSEMEEKALRTKLQHENQLKKLRLEKEIADQKKKIEDQDKKKKGKFYYENKLIKILPRVTELNLIAKQLKRNISMSIKLIVLDSQEYDSNDRTTIKVQVDNKQLGYRYLWDLNKFSNRYYMLKDLVDQYFATGVLPVVPQNQDPFWDPEEPVFIGNAYTYMKGLLHLMDNPQTISVIGENIQSGQVTIDLIPTDQSGTKNLCLQLDEQIFIEPEDLVGKPFYFKVKIDSGKINDNYTDCFVQYTLKVNEIDKETFRTEACKLPTKTPVWNYQRVHFFSCLDDCIKDYLEKSNLIFRLYGTEVLQKQKDQPKKSSAQKAITDQDIAKKEAISNTPSVAANTNLNVTVPTKPIQPSTTNQKQGKTKQQTKKKDPKKDEKNAEKKTGKKQGDCLLF